jgi:hypothetical protein
MIITHYDLDGGSEEYLMETLEGFYYAHVETLYENQLLLKVNIFRLDGSSKTGFFPVEVVDKDVIEEKIKQLADSAKDSYVVMLGKENEVEGDEYFVLQVKEAGIVVLANFAEVWETQRFFDGFEKEGIWTRIPEDVSNSIGQSFSGLVWSYGYKLIRYN